MPAAPVSSGARLGALKRRLPGAAEDGLVLRSLVDANLPKLTPDDADIFGGITRALFPGSEPTSLPDGGPASARSKSGRVTSKFSAFAPFLTFSTVTSRPKAHEVADRTSPSISAPEKFFVSPAS